MQDRINLNCDIDDVLIRSSDYIQGYVDSNTIFKSEMLSAIEQLKRNCQYFVNRIKGECHRAYEEGRIPVLSTFPNMDVSTNEGQIIDITSLSEDEKRRIYVLPIQRAHYYFEIAEKIMEQFLEQRDMFLELDNLPYGETKPYDYLLEAREMDHFKEMIRTNYEAMQRINKFCLKEARRIIIKAKETRTIPQYGDLVKMDANDILRTNNENNSQNYLLFEKPMMDIASCLDLRVLDFVLNKFEIKKSYSRTIVDYDRIYTVDHVDMDAVNAIRELMRAGKINILRFVTHHNGTREALAKERLVKTLFPGAIFIGMRFHDTEHHLVRRKRSSKFDGTKAQIKDFIPEDELLLDDSKENCNNWFNNEGLVILVRNITEAEKATGMERMAYPRIVDFEELTRTVNSILEDRKQKVKKLEAR